MNRTLASTLAFTGTAAAAFALAAISTVAQADDITIDPTPFVSATSRADVRAGVLGQSEAIRTAHGEGAPHANGMLMSSGRTRSEVRDDYLAARAQVSAFSGEDSGSAYISAMQPRRSGGNLVVAESQR